MKLSTRLLQGYFQNVLEASHKYDVMHKMLSLPEN